MSEQRQMRGSVIPEYSEKLGKMRPLPGYCFAETVPEAGDKAGALFVPETATVRNRPAYVAKVIAETAITWPPPQKTLAGLTGKTCLFAKYGGQIFRWNGMDLVKYRLDLEDVLAVFYEGEWVDLLSDGHSKMNTIVFDSGIRRCRYCKSKGKGNMFLDGNGVCPSCGRTSTGRKHIRSKYRIRRGTPNEQVIETEMPLPALGEELTDTMSVPLPKRVKGTVFSYPNAK